MNELPFSLKILTLTSTTTATTLGELVRSRLASISKTLPEHRAIIKIGLTSSATLLLSDGEMGDTLSLAANTRYEFNVNNPLDDLLIKNTATVTLELYYGKP